MTVVFPLPLGPRKPKISPFSTRKLTSLTAVNLPNRRTRCSAEMAASAGLFGALATSSIPLFEFHVRRHAGKHAPGRIVDANLHPKHLVYAFLAGLHIARQEFRLLVDLFENPIENRSRKRIDPHLGFLS